MAHKWLNWSRRPAEVMASSPEGTGKTDKTGILSVLSVQATPEMEISDGPRRTRKNQRGRREVIGRPAEVMASSPEGTDKTDKTGILSVLSVQATPEMEISDGPRRTRQNQRMPRDITACKRVEEDFPDPQAAEALKEITDLLVVSYERYRRVLRVPVSAPDPANKELALTPSPSVHGHGSQP